MVESRMVSLTEQEKRKISEIRAQNPNISAHEIMEKLSLGANKQHAVAGCFRVLKEAEKAAALLAQRAKEAEEKAKKEAEADAERAGAGAEQTGAGAKPAATGAQSAETASNMLEATLSKPEVLEVLAEKVLGKMLPYIQRGLGGNPTSLASTPQHIQGASFTATELALKVFDMLEQGSSFVDVMGELRLDEQRMHDLLERYGKMKAAEAKVSLMGEKYLEGWFKLAKYMGEVKRDECDLYSDDAGICTRFVTQEVEKDFRNKYPGMLKVVNKRTRFFVLEHPEICAYCDHKTGVV